MPTTSGPASGPASDEVLQGLCKATGSCVISSVHKTKLQPAWEVILAFIWLCKIRFDPKQVSLLDASGVDQSGVISALPTACGLAMIPFIVKPLDELAEVAMDVTFRKVSAPYLESCEV